MYLIYFLNIGKYPFISFIAKVIITLFKPIHNSSILICCRLACVLVTIIICFMFIGPVYFKVDFFSFCSKMSGSRLEKVTEIIRELANYLDKFKAVANAHTVEFIAHKQWNNLISEEVRSEMRRIPIESPQSCSLYENVSSE